MNDEGEAVGLEPDYKRLKKREQAQGDKDTFELHLRDLVRHHFGVAFASTDLHITFPIIADKEICRIDIKKGRVPQYLEATVGKGGEKVKKFYVRSGNSSVEIGLTEISDYIQHRFHSA